jgi:hypothetical protein
MSNEPQRSSPRPVPRRGAIARLVVGVCALAVAGGVFYLAAGLALGWRILIAIVVAAPLLLLVDLLRERGSPPPGAKARRWEDTD